MQHLPNNVRSGFDDEFLRGVRHATLKLLRYCHANDWAGYDPYDALNSEIFRALPFLNTRFPRLVFTQAMKRSPVNLRPMLKIPKTHNPKGLALFLIALLKLRELGLLQDEELLHGMLSRIIASRSPDSEYCCWGYSFPWQTRTLLVPRGAPNLICTIFVANALLTAFETLGDQTLLEMATSAGEYLVKTLYYRERPGVASFSYPLPGLKSKIHNANFLAAALLSRLYRHTGDDQVLEPALQAARYSAGKQKRDGSWHYGELRTQEWVDNFHTGYNLTSLRALNRNLCTSEFESHICRGFAFYRNHFIQEDGAVRYFHNATYPIDIHCVAQSLLTLFEFHELDSANVSVIRSVYSWAMKHMWDEKGFFYYRILPGVTIRTSYTRWSQAWMMLALTTLLDPLNQTDVRRDVKLDRSLVAIGD